MNEIIEHESERPALVVRQEYGDTNPGQLLQIAVQQGADLAKIEKLMDLHDRWEAKQAEKAYLAALAEFKKDPPRVIKDLVNKQYGSAYSSLPNLVNTVNEALGKFGLNASWDFDQTKNIRVTCRLSHVMGHSGSVSLEAAPDTSGAKNPIQQIKSTITYLQGVTFSGVTGIVPGGASTDDDGNGAGKPVSDVDLTVIREQAKKDALEWFVGYQNLVRSHLLSIVAIKNGIATKQYSISCEAWEEIDQETQQKLWVAPSKGGIFTTEERTTMKSQEFRESYFGASAA